MAKPSESSGVPAVSAVDLTDERVHWDLRETMSYGDYLSLDRLLACQNPLTGEHDEVLFIVIHQASELWIKLCLHEVTGAIRQIRTGELGPAFKMLARVARVTTLGEVTASLAHEVNQPLAAIVNNANACLGLLPDDRPELEEMRDALG